MKKWLLMIGCLCLVTCTPQTIQIEDMKWWGLLGPVGAVAFHTLTTDREDLNLAQWIHEMNDLSNPKVCTTVDTFAWMKGLLEKVCTDLANCQYITPQQGALLKSFFANVDQYKSRAAFLHVEMMRKKKLHQK